jgi:hypothetical protein
MLLVFYNENSSNINWKIIIPKNNPILFINEKGRPRDVTQYLSACPACTRPWVPSLALKKEKEKSERSPALYISTIPSH